MRKLLLYPLIIIILLLISLPYAMGFFSEKQLNRLITRVNESPASITLRLSDYQRGWFRSKAALTVSISPLKEWKGVDPRWSSIPDNQYTQAPIEFTLSNTVLHGPIIFPGNLSKKTILFGQGLLLSETELGSESDGLFAQLFAQSKVNPKIYLGLLIKFFGGTVLSVDSTPFQLKAPVGLFNLDWQGLQSEWIFSKDFKRLNGGSELDGLSVATPNGKMQLSKIRLRTDVNQYNDVLWLGESELELPELSITSSDGSSMTLRDFEITSGLNRKDTRLNVDFSIKLGRLTVGKETYGPGQLKTSFNGLDGASYEKLVTKVQEMNTLNEQQRQLASVSFLPLIVDMVSKGAEYQLTELNFMFPKGAVKASGKLVLTGDADSKSGSVNFLTFINRLAADFDLQISKELLSQILEHRHSNTFFAQRALQQPSVQSSQTTTPLASQQANNGLMTDKQITVLAQQAANKDIAEALAKGYLVRKGDDFSCQIAFSSGVLTFNGKPFGFGKS